jgi:protein-tyrosine phosphatase
MDQLTADDQEILLGLGIKSVIDLRRAQELNETPNVFHDDPRVKYLHHNMAGDGHLSLEGEPEVDTQAERVRLGYSRFLNQRQEAIKGILGALSEPANQPAIFHCAAGTDRTGVLAALLLALAGVPDETIGHDYALSADALFARYEAEGPPEGYEGKLTLESVRGRSAVADGMVLLMQYLRDEYGGAESYARHIGLTDTQIESIRRAILE